MDAEKKKKKKKNGLRLGAGIILNQELTYRRHWGDGLRALASALIKALASARGSEKNQKNPEKNQKNRASAYICFCRLRAKSRIKGKD